MCLQVRFYKDKSFSLYFSPKHIDSMYIDTTFCVPNALFIPTRDESAEAVLRLTKEWLSKGRNHFVRLKCSAGIGYEHLFIRLAEELETKVMWSAFCLFLKGKSRSLV